MQIHSISTNGLLLYGLSPLQQGSAAAGMDADGDQDGSAGLDAVNFSAQGQLLASQVQSGPTPWSQLAQALQAGDLGGAQQAFATIAQRVQAADPSRSGQGATAGQGSGSSLHQDYAALAQALQSGDLASAQQAFAQLQQDLQALPGRHHRHHHHGPAQAAANPSVDPTVGNVNVSDGADAPSGGSFQTSA